MIYIISVNTDAYYKKYTNKVQKYAEHMHMCGTLYNLYALYVVNIAIIIAMFVVLHKGLDISMCFEMSEGIITNAFIYSNHTTNIWKSTKLMS